jgi:hypothetical protein
MLIRKVIQVDVPVGFWAVTFDAVWSAPCNSGKHTDCLEHGCLDNEPDRISEIDGAVTLVTKANYDTLNVVGLDVNSNTSEQYDDTHDLRTRIFVSESDAREHLEYVLNRFRKPQAWESFVRL